MTPPSWTAEDEWRLEEIDEFIRILGDRYAAPDSDTVWLVTKLREARQEIARLEKVVKLLKWREQ